MDQLLYGSEVLINGLMTGVMYALVALGFVLIYKASGVFNFAQGAMVYFAALAVVGLMDKGISEIQHVYSDERLQSPMRRVGALKRLNDHV
mgnify:CR=1 FL=1